jgi:hypothetical protein
LSKRFVEGMRLMPDRFATADGQLLANGLRERLHV